MSYKTKDDSHNLANEPMGLYLTGSSFNPFNNLFGSDKLLRFTNDFDIVKVARAGFPKRILLAFAKKISLNIQELSDILHISERTLQRYDDDAIIKTEYAEKAIELARLYTRGEEVFGSMDKFKLWVKAPSVIFNGEAPVSMLDTSAGFDMVFKELGRIEHGIFA
ncbi:MAG TPA: antitoxin Xre/MbcA/ParS toxin-binding domain-containing protein [Mucilaginibacter sp.]|jgi:putative toxin-antitoxin system antitoxin component (TIGR02293 family)